VPLLLLVVLIAAGLSSACRRPPLAAHVSLSWTLTPVPPVVGPARLTLQATDASGQPVRAATLRVEGHMSHPGMAPVLSTARERGDGLYEADLQFTMRGDWILLVSGSVPGGGTLEQRIDVPGVGAPD
jgi:hypothetical protein